MGAERRDRYSSTRQRDVAWLVHSRMQRGQSIRIVVFDLFHTLINPEHFLLDSHRRAARIARELGLAERVFEEYWESSRGARNASRTPTVAERVAEYCRHQGTPRTLPEIGRALVVAGEPDDRALADPSPNVMEALRALRRRGCRLGVLSNCDEREARGWDRSPLRPLVDAWALSCDTGFLKPSLGAYRAILRALGVENGDHAAYVGDGESGELVGARHAGFARVVLMRGFVLGTNFPGAARLPEASQEADTVVDDLGELVKDGTVVGPDH